MGKESTTRYVNHFSKTFSDCGLIIREVFESDDVDEFMSVLDGQANAEPRASDKTTGGELFLLGDAFRP